MVLAVPLMATIKIVFENLEHMKPVGKLMNGPIRIGPKPDATPRKGNQ
jgi:hypothetical protein